MSDGWRDAYRLQAFAFPQLAYEAIYSVRQGNLPPELPPAEIARRSERRVLQSKLLVSMLLVLVALGGSAALSNPLESLVAPTLSVPLYRASVLGGLFTLELALIWWTGLQVVPTFLGSAILPTLETLPIPDRTIDRASFLLYLRLFDLPAIAALAATPLAVGLALHSALAGIAVLPGVVSAVAFALALSLATGRFFVRHVQGSPGGRYQTAIRWGYLLLWAAPAFAIYGYVTIGLRFVTWLAAATAGGPSLPIDGLFFAYPLPLAYLPDIAGSGSFSGLGGGPIPWLVVGGGVAVYAAATFAVIRWLPAAPRALGLERSESAIVAAGEIGFRPHRASASVVVKDLRIASRTPGYAFLILLPLLDAVAIGFWTIVSGPTPGGAARIAEAAVATAALIATFFAPAFFAIELIGFSYTRTLPLSERSLVLGKVALVSALYLAAAGTVLALTLVRLFAPIAFVLFILGELPAVIAAALFELGILGRVARRKGLPIPNLYSGGWWATAVAIPGIIVAGLPLAFYAITPFSSAVVGASEMGAIALVELGLAATFSLLVAGPREA